MYRLLNRLSLPWQRRATALGWGCTFTLLVAGALPVYQIFPLSIVDAPVSELRLLQALAQVAFLGERAVHPLPLWLFYVLLLPMMTAVGALVVRLDELSFPTTKGH